VTALAVAASVARARTPGLVGIGLATVALIAACPRVPGVLVRPQVRLEHLSTATISPGVVELLLTATVVNPNAAPLIARAVDWELSWGDEQARWRGRAVFATRVPARGTATLAVPVRLPPSSVASLTGVRTGKRPRVRGLVHFESRRGDIAVAVDEMPAADGHPARRTGQRSPNPN
jgi:hypothetical protein